MSDSDEPADHLWESLLFLSRHGGVSLSEALALPISDFHRAHGALLSLLREEAPSLPPRGGSDRRPL